MLEGGREHRSLRALCQGIMGMGKIKVVGALKPGGGTGERATLGKHCKMLQKKSDLLPGKYVRTYGLPSCAITWVTGEGPFSTLLTLILTFSH